MQGRIDLKAAAYNAGRGTAGQIVLFDQQGFHPGKLTLEGCGHTGISGAHNHNIISGHVYIPPLILSVFPFDAC